MVAMGTTLYILTCALATAQPAAADLSDWQGPPRLSRGQELVYRGTFTEEANNQGVLFQRTFRLENRVFVLETMPDGASIAFFTAWKGRSAKQEKEAETTSVRLEVARMKANGRLETDRGASLAAPLDGPPLVECGAFVELPKARLAIDQTWEVLEAGRPARTWRVAAVETVNNTRCLKLVGAQQSEDWDAPRPGRNAWRRRDIVWLLPRTGCALKVERTIERREPARPEVGQKLVLKYELDSSMQYPGQLYEDRRREITQAQALGESVASLLPRAAQVGPRPFEALLTRIQNITVTSPPTPYREALKHVQRLAEVGKRGEAPPELPADDDLVPQIAHGKPAPEFLVKDLTTKESVRLRHWLGRPTLLVFYSPTSPTIDSLLRFAQDVHDRHGDTVHVVTLAVSEDVERVLQQRRDMKVTVPVLSGTGLRLSYAIEATPKLVVLDSAGVVRTSCIGWGPETPYSVLEDLRRCRPVSDAGNRR